MKMKTKLPLRAYTLAQYSDGFIVLEWQTRYSSGRYIIAEKVYDEFEKKFLKLLKDCIITKRRYIQVRKKEEWNDNDHLEGFKDW